MPSPTAEKIAAAATAQPTLPDDLLEDIFLRLDDAADLVGAYASCTSFRRIVSDRCFRRRYCSLHRPPVIGVLSYNRGRLLPGDLDPSSQDCVSGFYPAEPPHRSAPAARAVVRAADFTFSFLSDPIFWRVQDVRDGRILLSRHIPTVGNIDLIVFDPLHRRHIQIPPIPDGDLVACTTRQRGKHFEPFLDPSTEKEKETEEDGLPFRVICNVISGEKIWTFVFSSVTGKWRAVASFVIEACFRWLKYTLLLRRHYACSCFCWTGFGTTVMLVLQTREMKFSIVDLPPECDGGEYTIVETEEGRLGLLILAGRMLFIFSNTWPDNGNGVKDWRYDNAIPLIDCQWSFSGGAEGGYALLQGVRVDQHQKKEAYTQYFTVELKTLLVKRLCAKKSGPTSPDYLYASFPPPLSLPAL